MPESGVRRAIAVEAAREVFWTRGYDDTSIADIVSASGLNRYALYSEFGGKRELFLACVADFVDERRRRICPILADKSMPPMERIAASLDSILEYIFADSRGCLITHTALELAREDPVVAGIVHRYFEEFTSFLVAPLREAAAEGSLNSNVTPEKGASLLVALKMSLSGLARAGAPQEKLREIAETALASLRTVSSQKNHLS